MITIPKSHGPDYGLSLIRNRYRARFYEDGAMRQKALGTSKLNEARVNRDKFYAELIAKGAISNGDMTTATGSSRYVYQQAPFFVRIKGKHIGGFDTFEEACAARDKHLGIEAEPTDTEEGEFAI